MQVNWISPQLGRIILLKTGFDTSDDQHYGLVVAAFKIKGQHTRYVVSAPGTSLKSTTKRVDSRDLEITSADADIGKTTIFHLHEDSLKVNQFPSDEILESNRPRIQQDQISCEVSSVKNLDVRLRSLESVRNKSIESIVTETLKNYGIPKGSIAPISDRRKEIWLSPAQSE